MQRIRGIIGFLALTAFALRCLVPMGFMLMSDHGESDSLLGVKIVICTGNGPVTRIQHDGSQHSSMQHEDGHVPDPHKQHQQSSHDLCPFASQGTHVTTVSTPEPIATTVRYARVVYALTSQIYAATPDPGPTSARGPPSTTV